MTCIQTAQSVSPEIQATQSVPLKSRQRSRPPGNPDSTVGHTVSFLQVCEPVPPLASFISVAADPASKTVRHPVLSLSADYGHSS